MVIQQENVYSSFNVYFAAFIVNFAATSATCVMSWSSPTLPLITKPGQRIFITLEDGAMLSSLVALGASVGPFLNSHIVDYFGRKLTLIWAMILLIISWTILYFSSQLLILYCARFIAGVAVGCVYATVPMFMGEIAPVNLRGSLISLLQFFDCIGYLIEYIIGGYVSYDSLILISAALPLLSIFSLIWIPESPYHLHNKGKKNEAIKSLRFYRNYADVSNLQKEITDMEISAQNIECNKGSIKLLFTKRGNLKAVYHVATLLFFQQTSGVNIVMFYSKTIFEESGSSYSANTCSIIIAAVMASAAVGTMFSSRVFKVKTLLCISAIGNTISMIVFGTYFYLTSTEINNNNNNYGWVPVTCLMTYIFTYASGFGPLAWVLCAEIFPSYLKAIGCALSASFVWFLCFILTRYFISFCEFYGKATSFWLLGSCSFVSIFYVIFQLPDTHGKTFQEIQEMIQGTKSHKKKTDEHL